MRSTTKKGPRTPGLRKALARANSIESMATRFLDLEIQRIKASPYAPQVAALDARLNQYRDQVSTYVSVAEAALDGVNALARPGTPPAEPEPAVTPKGPAPLPAPAGAEPEANPNITRRPGSVAVAKGEPGWFKLIEEAQAYARQVHADALIALADASQAVDAVAALCAPAHAPKEGQQRAISCTEHRDGTLVLDIGEQSVTLNTREAGIIQRLLARFK